MNNNNQLIFSEIWKPIMKLNSQFSNNSTIPNISYMFKKLPLTWSNNLKPTKPSISELNNLKFSLTTSPTRPLNGKEQTLSPMTKSNPKFWNNYSPNPSDTKKITMLFLKKSLEKPLYSELNIEITEKCQTYKEIS